MMNTGNCIRIYWIAGREWKSETQVQIAVEFIANTF